METDLPLAGEPAAVFARMSGLLLSTETVAATDPVVTRADDLQYELDEGPCLTAWEERTAVRVTDLTCEDRWPRWAPAAAVTGVRAVLSAPLVSGDDALGALKVYSRHAGTYRDHDEHLLTMFGAHAAVLRARDLVNVAKGVLMHREGTDEQTAFLLLSTTAEAERRPLHEVAETIAGTTTRRRR